MVMLHVIAGARRGQKQQHFYIDAKNCRKVKVGGNVALVLSACQCRSVPSHLASHSKHAKLALGSLQDQNQLRQRNLTLPCEYG